MVGRRVRWLVTALLALAAAVPLSLVSVSAASAASGSVSGSVSTGSIHVVNAVAGTTAAVRVDGDLVRASAAPKSVIGPLALPAGQHVLELEVAGVSLVSARFTVRAGDSLDIVAHRAADRAMTPSVTVFKNDLSPVGPGKTRLVVSHVAVAGPADIRIDGRPYFRNVANAESLSIVLPAGGYSLDVVPTVTASRSILAPVRVNLAGGTLTRVFAFGNPEESSSDAIVQVLQVPVSGSGVPVTVGTGDGGQAADGLVTSAATVWGAVAVALAGLALAGVAGATRGSARSARIMEGRRLS